MPGKLYLGFIANSIRVNCGYASKSRLNRSVIAQNDPNIRLAIRADTERRKQESTWHHRQNRGVECSDARGIVRTVKSVTVLLGFTGERLTNISNERF